jgi:pimeloyl-ACP methyl ester carboxylesterase
MKKLCLEKMNRMQVRFVFLRSLLLSIAVAACLANPSVGETTTSAVVEAEQDLKLANSPSLILDARAGHYLHAADIALSILRTSGTDLRSREIYNEACSQLTSMLRSGDSARLWNRTETITFRGGIYRLHFAAGSRKEGTWAPGYFDFLLTPSQVHEKVTHDEARINDSGGVLVGVYKPADPMKYFLPLVGVAVPVTATLDFTPSVSIPGRMRDATLTLYDPTRRETVRIDGNQRTLAADFGAPLAYYPESGSLGLMAMFRPANYENRAGLYMLEPYDPERIPVVLIRGLMSIPQMWLPTISAIESDPELRGRYQFWVFAYPTGDPITLSALKLRESLARVYQLYPKTKDMVLVSHSMGGLVSQMQSVTTKRVLWDDVFRGDADRLYAKLPSDNVIKQALIFDENPRVQRIVFICVPHRGADLAINWIGALGNGLISLPGKVLGGAITLTTVEKDVGLKHLPTGINGLSPRSAVLRGLDTLPIQAPYHTIVGDRGRGDTPNSSDGVVAYWSPHLTGAKSELVVPGPHGSYALPQTVSELKRILHLNLIAVTAPRSKEILKGQRSADGRPPRSLARNQTLAVRELTVP